mmetsp:Transcript_16754/g.48644  ORF Transcript_16754/g.48644 Transcript_16754/m.48644 type:complete len:248 (-) Transcript_16754:616-1359(-)
MCGEALPLLPGIHPREVLELLELLEPRAQAGARKMRGRGRVHPCQEPGADGQGGHLLRGARRAVPALLRPELVEQKEHPHVLVPPGHDVPLPPACGRRRRRGRGRRNGRCRCRCGLLLLILLLLPPTLLGLVLRAVGLLRAALAGRRVALRVALDAVVLRHGGGPPRRASALPRDVVLAVLASRPRGLPPRRPSAVLASRPRGLRSRLVPRCEHGRISRLRRMRVVDLRADRLRWSQNLLRRVGIAQ